MLRPILVLAAALALGGLAGPASAQSVGYVTGIPGPDPAGGDEIGWGPAYRPETSFSQPGTPPTPGDYAGAAYRARTGRGVYEGVQAGVTPGTEAPALRPRRMRAAAPPARRHAVRHHRQAAR
ncbi:hypothetical protein M446_5809 [Methylobacterium sp. 4-46]|uniref:hypothetical protein n=1 Tax=unclassified Methylobacterium TaxID=2615210 RepID=UPI000152CD41|nr:MULTISPECIES: hypothetical protein [Methylobacterium]ACA20096.1 hypothetical protein M446_5809 [Methylobacterium sp. 4-46]WFT79281.1 hypothetical protein QA634_29315 [Methylobacterium nodulans]